MNIEKMEQVMKRMLSAAMLVGLCAFQSQSAEPPIAKELFKNIETATKAKPEPLGSYAKGCLAGGVQLFEDGPTWAAMRLSRGRNWGHPELAKFIGRLTAASKTVGYDGLLIGDLGRARGGPMISGHRSHQITASQRENWSSYDVVKGRSTLDKELWEKSSWRAIQLAAEDDAVARIFVNATIKRELCRRSKGEGWLRKVRAWWGHDAHFHVRLSCPEGMTECVNQAPPPAGDGCGKELDWWFTDEPYAPSDKPPPRDLTMADLPHACQAVFLGLLGLLFASPVLAEGKVSLGQSETRPVRFSDSNPRETRFGQLEFLGGLEWWAKRADFGGFSGMLLDDDNTLTALTDKGHWARARLIFNPQGALAAIEGLEVWRLYSANGGFLKRPFTDSEAITRDGDALLISFEGGFGGGRVSRFANLWAPEAPVVGLPDLSGLGSNQGLESLLKLPDGRLVMIAEEPANGTDHMGWILKDGVSKPFTVKREAAYSPTDLALGPLFGGPGMRIRRFPLSELRPGAVIKGEELINLGAGHAVDNMEALATRRGKFGGTELFVLSDDNFSYRQRTLLLHFRVRDGG